jgi:hypothetical protein
MFSNCGNKLVSLTVTLSLMLSVIWSPVHGQQNLLAFEDVECFVFDDVYSNQAGPSDAVYIRENAGPSTVACIPDGSQFGSCRRWFGRCRTKITNRPVSFYVFDDGYSNRAGSADAIFFGQRGNSFQAACISGGQFGNCRKWFGQAHSDRGAIVTCRVFDDGYTNLSSARDAIFIPGPGGGLGPQGAATPGGDLGRRFGRCTAPQFP